MTASTAATDGELLQRARRVLPGITQTYSKAPDQQVEGVYPVFLERGEGCRVWDLAGNAYIDYPCALGPMVLGYADAEVDAAARDRVNGGPCFSLGHRLEVEVAELLVEMVPGAEMVRFLKTGSEATTATVRLARAATGRDHVAMCGYHGWHDWAIGHTTRSAGVPPAVRELTHQWTYNDLESLRAVLEKHRGGVAAVIMEPVGVEPPAPGFLEGVRALADEHGALLIFDEVITGFRLAPGGAQEYFGVLPDLAAFGKAMANGYPLAAVTGRATVMEQIASTVFISSTFGGDTVSLAASLATMRRIRAGGVIEHLWRQGARIMEGFNALASEHEVPARMIGLAPRRVIAFEPAGGADGNGVKGLLWQECLDRGVLMGNANFVSLAHDDAAVDATLDAFDGALAVVGQAVRQGDVTSRLRGHEPAEVFRRA
ncbi:MAG: aminotransferase class III-fold pyridoxal phosphate-dependent enzyme [Candidatus Dormibacteraeota bacterium]|uniref:Aminotransferase class III-fold pyridoxal phosphate-dependent enzyme n=1 Tax=Candidatus Aeolococcus gillhamiae TaxID=3127015 RepID=A0A2W6A4W7_9BACT|nr:aminotransferase class III-fold pyridoxal phosphate-dependent enzyme [Candidatus Dormibacteraeota bacterium]PZR80408.1 MAG: aspartate aminotransferase family protein [Candidatus Dormibacter sp. RRmetagenome_bin12]